MHILKTSRKVKLVENKDGEVEEIVAEEGNFAFCMQLQALEFMAE